MVISDMNLTSHHGNVLSPFARYMWQICTFSVVQVPILLSTASFQFIIASLPHQKSFDFHRLLHRQAC